jgi:hypothetical protein
MERPSPYDRGEGRADYRTDYIAAGRSWTPLDVASPGTADSRAIWITLDESGQRAECSKPQVEHSYRVIDSTHRHVWQLSSATP